MSRSAAELSRLIAERRMSCAELMAATLDRIDAVNPRINAIVSLRDRDVLMAEAGERDRELARGERKGWMHGLPHAIKDLEDTAGIPTTCGSPLLRDNVPAQDSLVTQRIKAAGAIVIGKTNVPEFGYGSQTYNDVFGPTRNPYDLSRTAGGSSGGAAAALAARLLPVADGSDYMGSLRNPAAFCNVYGFRPSHGRIPGVEPGPRFLAAIGTEGPMARTPEDLKLHLQTLAEPDPRDPLAQSIPVGESPAPARPRIAWLGDLGLPYEPGILALCERALEATGWDVEPSAPGFDPERAWQAAITIRHFDATWALELDLQQVKPEIRYEAEGARRVTGTELYAAQVVRGEVFDALTALLGTHDALALPSAQVFPFDVETHWPQTVAGHPMDTYHRWMQVVAYASLAGLPTVNVPVGFRDGLPMGMQLIGRPRADAATVALAAAYHEVANHVENHPPPFP
jgi:Asp-tRNA(Asn)/Glu-tRNA(Gln) amidotransferase A subunit family amidase